jgi:hypothetical protein
MRTVALIILSIAAAQAQPVSLAAVARACSTLEINVLIASAFSPFTAGGAVVLR